MPGPETGSGKNESGESKYLGTPKAEFDHYYGNHIGTITLNFQLRKEDPDSQLSQEGYARCFENFMNGLRLTLRRMEEGSVREDPKINRCVIQEFIDLGEKIKDPSNEAEISQIVEKYETVQNPEQGNENK